jgi:hypothetical protein
MVTLVELTDNELMELSQETGKTREKLRDLYVTAGKQATEQGFGDNQSYVRGVFNKLINEDKFSYQFYFKYKKEATPARRFLKKEMEMEVGSPIKSELTGNWYIDVYTDPTKTSKLELTNRLVKFGVLHETLTGGNISATTEVPEKVLNVAVNTQDQEKKDEEEKTYEEAFQAEMTYHRKKFFPTEKDTTLYEEIVRDILDKKIELGIVKVKGK